MCFSEEEEELLLAAVAAMVEQEVRLRIVLSISVLLFMLGFVEAYLWIFQVSEQEVTFTNLKFGCTDLFFVNSSFGYKWHFSISVGRLAPVRDSQGDLLDVRFFCTHYFVNCDLRQKRSILNWFWHQCLAFKKSYWYSYISQNVKNHISENFKIHFFVCVVCIFVKGGRRERKTCSQIPCWKVHCFATYHASYASIIQFSCQPSSDHTFISFSNINSACNGKRNL